MAGASSTDGRAIFGAKADAVIQWWNWKAAMLSVAFRAPIFIATTYAYGWRSVSLAVLVEAAYRAGTSECSPALSRLSAIGVQPGWRPC